MADAREGAKLLTSTTLPIPSHGFSGFAGFLEGQVAREKKFEAD